jgi:hypothetical protein
MSVQKDHVSRLGEQSISLHQTEIFYFSEVQSSKDPPGIWRVITSNQGTAVSFYVLSSALFANIQLSSYRILQTVHKYKREFLKYIEVIICLRNRVGSTFGIRPLYRKLKVWVKKFTDLLEPVTALSFSNKLPKAELVTASCLTLYLWHYFANASGPFPSC